MMENRKDHAPRTLAELCRALDDPESTPEDVRSAADWGAIPAASARAWLAGYLTGRRAAPPRSAPVLVKLQDEA